MSEVSQIQSIFAKQRLLPIIQADTVEQGIAVTAAMKKAGLSIVEVVLRNEQALALAKEIKATFPELTLGVGTVYNTEILDKAVNAGADFIVTPATTPKLTEALLSCGKPVLPGVSTLSDMATMLEHGITEMKLFPANIVGGIGMLKAVSSLFKEASFCPTGGVTADNLPEFLSQPNVFAAGGTWVTPKAAVANEQWDEITKACEIALAAC